MGGGLPSSPYHTCVTPWAGYTQHNVSYVPYISFHMPCHNTHLTTHVGYIVCTQYSVKPRSSAPYVVYRSRYMRPPHWCGVPCCTKRTFQHYVPYTMCTLWHLHTEQMIHMLPPCTRGHTHLMLCAHTSCIPYTMYISPRCTSQC